MTMFSEVKYEDVEDLCKQMHALNVRVRDILEEIEQEKITNSWSSKAEQTYMTEFLKLKSNFDTVILELEYAIIFMAKATGGFEKLDDNFKNEILMVLKEFSLSGSKIFPNN